MAGPLALTLFFSILVTQPAGLGYVNYRAFGPKMLVHFSLRS